MIYKELSDNERENVNANIKDFAEDEKTLNLLSSIFKVLGDPTRLKIIYALSQSPLCVTDISNMLEMSQSSISHQLALLRNKELIKVDRIGRKAIYSLDDEHVISLFKEGYEHAEHKQKE
ncbi:ArsR/SmtB family transcription factor [Peptoniphilus stercorisuis]|uniref:ArsR family transcriptional regulator n=1 Tax=Peptoniphilus stercorisuis TaxID=1436965 RepID=A0ABS4KA46_9FIRM|nr:metalloregulator ArsR/SmtB family transcription factor [Peptoniphilus stercorisuis]MBP2024648.1 ArsR family transcriptional regulator [Peptoniphilus stercorisuis]